MTVMPNRGVPPAKVLQKLVPIESLRDLAQWTEVHFNDTKDALMKQRAGRKRNLALWDSSNISELMLNNEIDTKYEIPKISPDLRSPYPMILPKLELYGVKPSGGGLRAATSCNCEKKPTYYIRKRVSKYAKWFDDLKDQKSSKQHTFL